MSTTYSYSSSIEIACTPEQLFDFHTDHKNLGRITPDGIRVETLYVEPTAVGSRIEMKVTQFGFFTSRWTIVFVGYERPTYLADEMKNGPFSYWLQERRISTTDNGSVLLDSVTYRLPFGILGSIAHSLFVKKQIETMFRLRQQRTKELLEQKH
ncbi:MAG: SRPBCC family protein [Candidatus Kapabacteria bacterium]|nr:SRPBCC family protein [Candidatus Kapabacteria bacterium]